MPKPQTKVRRREFLAATPAALLSRAQAPAVSRPHLLMIYCDDLGWGDLGCYGNRVIQTPHLDGLASRGTRFSQFYTTSPVCTPSRASLLTGHYPHRYGIHHADLPESLPRYPLPESAVTLARLLKDTGYYTAHVGKWHLGEPPQTIEPRRRGFDHFFACLGGRPSSSWGKHARSMDPEVVVNENRPVVHKGHVTEVQTRAALEVIDRLAADRPLFLNLWFNAPHEPLAPLPHQGRLYRDWSAEEQTYFQTVSDMDEGVGRILARLQERGMAGNTLILFSSDNGPEAHRFAFSRGSAGPLKGMKTQLWEGGIRVPGILCWPGKVPAGRVSQDLASILDVFPTFTAAAGVSMPAGHRLDGGVDLVRVANGGAAARDRALFFEFHFPQRGVAASLPMAVRTGRWKLFANHDFTAQELYDLENDAGERNNVAAQHPKVVEEMSGKLRRWWAQFGDQVDLSGKRTSAPTPSLEELEKVYYRN